MKKFRLNYQAYILCLITFLGIGHLFKYELHSNIDLILYITLLIFEIYALINAICFYIGVNEIREEYKIQQGNFDNISTCKYNVPDYWSIGAVYKRLIEILSSDNLIDKLFEVYNSWITEYIDNYNIAVYYMTPKYLKLCYEEGRIIE